MSPARSEKVFVACGRYFSQFLRPPASKRPMSTNPRIGITWPENADLDACLRYRFCKSLPCLVWKPLGGRFFSAQALHSLSQSIFGCLCYVHAVALNVHPDCTLHLLEFNAIRHTQQVCSSFCTCPSSPGIEFDLRASFAPCRCSRVLAFSLSQICQA